MKRPSFQFYPGDWTGNSNLRRCTHAEKGAWLDIMCLMHDQEEYGVLRWPMKEIAQAAGCPVALVKGLVAKGVLKGDDKVLDEPFVYTPRSGRKDGEPVTLVTPQDGPIWYSSRMVKDEYVRSNAGASTRFGAENKADSQPPRKPNSDSDRAKLRARVLEKTGGSCYHCSVRLGERWEIDHLMPRSKGGRHTFANLVPSCVACNQDKSDTLPDDWDALRHSPSHSPSRRHGEDKGDGSSSSSSSSPSGSSVGPNGPPDAGASKPQALPEGLTPSESLFQVAVPWLVARGMKDGNARSLLGGAVKQLGASGAWELASECMRTEVMEPGAWLSKALNERIARQPSRRPGSGLPPQNTEAINAEAKRLLFGDGGARPQHQEVIDV
ncbi:HNH endonuclease [Achromobacter xylosoxidans]|uniref:HNH endonuclease n=2 Tax=Alcaligenes xylosoxydans xylosoxydans TaxID=85698 RepID=UPI0009F6E7C8|nr:HNH endonuclease [Achromobacter xylosoxidans]